VVAEVCGSGGCSRDGDKSIKSKYYVPTGFMAFTARHSLILESLSLFDSSYYPLVRHCGSMYLSKIYSEKAASGELGVNALSAKYFYPIPEAEIGKYFTQDNLERWQSITTAENGPPFAFHFWGSETRNMTVAKSSLMWRALSDFSISDARDMSNLHF